MYCGVAAAVLLVAVIIIVLIFFCVMKLHTKRKRARYADNFILNPVIAEGKATFPKEFPKKTREVDKELIAAPSPFNDPLEFPREKLFMTDVVLGK